jgi:hypothetical protein
MAIIDFFMTNRGRILIGTAVALIILALILAIVNFGGSGTQQDAWICKDGQWVRQGNPQGPMPESGCGQGVIN